MTISFVNHIYSSVTHSLHISSWCYLNWNLVSNFLIVNFLKIKLENGWHTYQPIRSDSIRCRKISADTIRLLNYLQRRRRPPLNRIDAETPPRQVPREKEERARKKEDRGEVPRKTAAGGRAATKSSFMQLAHRCRSDGRIIVSYEPWRLCGHMYRYG